MIDQAIADYLRERYKVITINSMQNSFIVGLDEPPWISIHTKGAHVIFVDFYRYYIKIHRELNGDGLYIEHANPEFFDELHSVLDGLGAIKC